MDTRLDIAREMRKHADSLEARDGGDNPAIDILRFYADKLADANDWPYQFTLENNFQDAESCLDDARFVAVEREYYGVARLVDHALACLRAIGRITGLDGTKRIEQEVAE